MTTIVLPQSADSQPGGRGGFRLAVASALTVWLLLVLSFGAAGAFVGPPGTPPLPIAIGVAAPLVLFFASLRLSQSFREFVLSLDLRLIVGMQAWRWAGLGFLSLYAHNVLPAVFALPAGLGDMAIGVTAPWIILALVRQPGFAASGTFIRWNVLGILDLIIAVGIGTVSAFFATGAPGEISTAPMATLPLLLIPAFLVPLFLMLHTAALMQSRQLIRSQA
ncbi:MAG TPA: hypothetical protein VGO37_10420 [Steroidobacteraceae bacterium]|jgi:hypothetical protein|nr:hypothetical protein [Steroidobacteraceae bacterium]